MLIKSLQIVYIWDTHLVASKYRRCQPWPLDNSCTSAEFNVSPKYRPLSRQLRASSKISALTSSSFSSPISVWGGSFPIGRMPPSRAYLRRAGCKRLINLSLPGAPWSLDPITCFMTLNSLFVVDDWCEWIIGGRDKTPELGPPSLPSRRNWTCRGRSWVLWTFRFSGACAKRRGKRRMEACTLWHFNAVNIDIIKLCLRREPVWTELELVQEIVSKDKVRLGQQ